MATPKKNGDPDVPSQLPTGLPEGASTTSQWIMNSINLLHSRLTGIEDRLSSLEKNMRFLIGFLAALGVIWTIVQFLFSQYDINLTPKK